MVKLTRREAEYIVATGAAADFLTEGRFTAAVARPVKAAAKKAGAFLGRQFLRGVSRAPATARFVVMRHPVALGLGLLYIGITERERIAEAARQGYEIVDEVTAPARERVRETVDPLLSEAAEAAARVYPEGPGIRADPRIIDPIISRLGIKRPRKPSNYNKAVSAGMKAIKASTSFGKKGVIKPAKRAFSTVISVGKGLKAKRKAPKKGIRRKVYTAMKRFYR